MQDIIAKGSGVLDLSRLAAAPVAPPTPALPTPGQGKTPQALLTLTPTVAARFSPTAPPPSSNPASTPDTLPLDSATWQIEALPRGDYDLILQAALPTLESPAEIQLSLGAQTLRLPLHKRHLTSGPGDLRLLRLGRLSLPVDVQNEPLQISVSRSTGGPSPLRFRQLLIARAKTDPTGDGPTQPPVGEPPAKP
jgi:hypothetical protein